VRAFLEGLLERVSDIRAEGIGTGPGPLTALDDMIASTLSAWSGEARSRRHPAVYEDAALDGAVQVDTEHFGPALAALHELVSFIAPLGVERLEQGTMRRILDERFGGGRVGLLTFYETYFREHVKPAAEARRARRAEGGEPPAPEQPDDSGAGRQRAARSQLLALVARKWAASAGAKEIGLSRDEIAAVAGPASPLPDLPHSLSVFVNWVPRSEAAAGGQIVLPHLHCLPGFGKYFSRFLYLLPDEVLGALRAESASPRNVVLAEIAGDQAFNANLRPPTQQCEIVYPTGDRIGCPEAIEVGELEVGPVEDEQRIALFERGTGRRVLPLDLGFLNPFMRPPLYQLLRRFSPSASTRLQLPTGLGRRAVAATDGAEGAPPGLIRRPRITYRDLVVIAREAWAVPGETLPQPEPAEWEADYFLRVQAWRLAHGLPDLVYLRAVPLPSAGASAAQAAPEGAHQPGQEVPEAGAEPPRPRPSADLRKPQYLDFRSPVLVGLLARYRSRGEPFIAVFEECLPAPEHLPRSEAGARFVTESILQLEIGPGRGGREAILAPSAEPAHARA
jgi:hypothetical protein